MKAIFEDLTKKIITKEDLILFLEEINLLERVIFKNIGAPLSERVREKVGEEFREYIKKLEKEGLVTGSPEQQFSFFEGLKKELQKIPQVKLAVAFEPSRDFLFRLKKWFREENQKEVILDMTINPGVVGGAIIEYQGRYRNFSLSKKIDELQLKIKD